MQHRSQETVNLSRTFSRLMEFIAAYSIILAAISGAFAMDPDPLQDFCVADYTSGVRVNGLACKPAANVTADDFHYDGLAQAVAPNNSYGISVLLATVDQYPGLNTMGVSFGRVDFAPGGAVPPHTHPRATEVLFVLDGVLNATFITTTNQYISRTVKKNDIFVIPRGLIHFVKNEQEDKPAAYLASLNSQQPGTQAVLPDLFKS